MSNRVSGISDIDLQQSMGLPGGGMRGRYMPGMFAQSQDRFTGTQQQPQQEFSIWRAAGKFFQGAVVDTITGLFSVKGVAMMVGAGLVCAAGGAPLVLAAGLGLGGFQLLKGAFGAASNYASGNYAEAEESFRDIGGGTVAVAGAAVGLRARYAAVKAEGGSTLGALWSDLSGKTKYSFTNSSGGVTSGSMYEMMGSRAKSGWGAVAEVFNPAEGTKSTFFGRLKGLFVAEESVAGARVSAQETATIVREQGLLKAGTAATDELVAAAIENKLVKATDPVAALAEIKGLTPDKFSQLKSGLSTLAEAEVFAADGAMVAEAAKLRPGLTAEMIKGMTPAEFTALQEQMAHATRLAEFAAAKPDSSIRLAADKFFPKRDFSVNPLNPAEMAQLEAGAGLLEAASTKVTSFGGNAAKVPAELVTSLETVRPGITAAEIAAMTPEELAIAMADQQIAAQAANTPSFFTRIFQSDFWRNTFGRRDGSMASTSEATATNSSRYTIGETTYTNYNSGLATTGTRRIIGATAGNIFRGED